MSDAPNIIAGAFGEHTEAREAAYQARCRHDGGWEIDEHGRLLRCAICGCDLDPYKVLAQYARREREWKYNRAELRRQGVKLANLRKLEKQTKARLKHADRKDAENVRAEERKRAAEGWQRVAYGLLSMAGQAEALALAVPGVPRVAKPRRRRIQMDTQGGITPILYETRYQTELREENERLRAELAGRSAEVRP